MRQAWKVIALLNCVLVSAAVASEAPGVTSTSIKIGGVFPFSGPASSLGNIGKGLAAYISSVNARGGINGRKIDYITMDDAYLPAKAVEHVRKLVEQDDVAFLYGELGTPGNTAVAKYLLSKQVPSVSIVSGSAKFTDIGNFPLTTTGVVSYRVEGLIYAKFLKARAPDGKYGILYQNDDLGKDYVAAFSDYFGKEFESRVIAVPYEVQDPSVDSQVVKLKNSGVTALLVAGTPKFAAQAIRRAAELGWKPIILINFPSASLASTLKPAGYDNSRGVIVGTIVKEVIDPRWASDPGIIKYSEFFREYLPGADIADGNYSFGFTQGQILEQILKQCGDNLSRDNILKQAKSLRMTPTLAMPGIEVTTSETSNMNWTQMQLQQWNGTGWEPVGAVLDATIK